MKDLLEKLVGLVPAYFEDLLPLVSGPKGFVAGRLVRERAMQGALTFLAVSFSIAWILKIPFLRGDPLLELGTDGVFFLVNVMAYGTALFAAWRLVGGRADIQNFLTVHFYYSSIVNFIDTAVFLCIMGTMRAVDPLLYKDFYDAVTGGKMASFMIENSERLLANPAYRLSLGLRAAGFVAFLTWMCVGWGAYREINQLSKVRSTVAGLLFLAFCLPVTAFILLVANALVR
jgi:hypothetical protein